MPASYDVQMIECDVCAKWFHVGLRGKCPKRYGFVGAVVMIHFYFAVHISAICVFRFGYNSYWCIIFHLIRAK